MLYLFPSTTHPVTNGAQVRANALLRHFISDLGWEVEFFCPTGSRDSSAWGENAALLRAIHIPDPPPARGAAARLIASLGARARRLGRFREGDCSDLAREKEIELGTIARFDAVFAITPHDEAVLRRELPGARICAVEIEPPPASAPPGPSSASCDLVFLGADNEANRLAVRHFCRVLLPMIRKAVPGVTAAIGGKVSESAEARRDAEGAGVRLAGYVSSASEFIASGRVFAAPIVAGGGVKVKILEAMACGVPVVTTPIGAEGIACENGADCLIARDDAAFAQGVAALLASPGRREEIARCARERLRARAAGGAFYRRCDRMLEEALAL
jgi:hypothetical protein